MFFIEPLEYSLAKLTVQIRDVRNATKRKQPDFFQFAATMRTLLYIFSVLNAIKRKKDLFSLKRSATCAMAKNNLLKRFATSVRAEVAQLALRFKLRNAHLWILYPVVVIKNIYHLVFAQPAFHFNVINVFH